MKLIKPSFEILEEKDIFKSIELAGRTCYKSEDKITEDSAEKFVQMLINSGHGAMLEHGTVYLHLGENEWKNTFEKDAYKWNSFIDKYKTNKYSIVNNNEFDICITTNYRVLVEKNWLEDLKYQCEPTEYHEKRITIKFVCDRGVSHEFVRHRVFSFAQESTRFCNYSKDKHDNQLTFIIPSWMSLKEGVYKHDRDVVNGELRWGWYDGEVLKNISAEEDLFLSSLAMTEEVYLKLTNDKNKWKAQQARNILPNALKTELIMSGFVSDWEHFFELRCDKSAHPDARALAIPLKEEFIKRKYI